MSQSLNSLLKPYKGLLVCLIILTITGNGLNLLIPKIIARAIDSFNAGTFVLRTTLIEFLLVALAVFILLILQSITQTYTAERVARDLREKLAYRISQQTYTYVENITPGKILTNLTSDIDSIKGYVSLGVVSIISSTVLIIGSATLLLLTNWKLALAILTIIPLFGIIFYTVLGKVRPLFLKSREIIDRLNKVINESILGAALIRVLHSNSTEYHTFSQTNNDAKNLGMNILSLFATMIPLITFIASLASLTILALGGHFVITGTLSLGDFAAFNSYIGILILPIIILGFISNVIAQAQASFSRVSVVLNAPLPLEASAENISRHIVKNIDGNIIAENISLSSGDKKILKDISFAIRSGTKTAIIGPTAAGKTQLLYMLIGLIAPTSGTISYDGQPLSNYDSKSLHRQIGFVFQDSVMFNLSLRENISFSDTVDDAQYPEALIEKAIETAELGDFIHTLPDGLNTLVSERGTSLSGGQKQRIMLARALALNPKILLLDDFTARVDRNTEQKILTNIEKNYPDITLVSVTQKISSIEHYDQIILLMEGEVLATGTHTELMSTSPEYIQIYNSQQSTQHYELQS